MKIIEYFGTDNKEYRLSKIKESGWEAGQYLHELLKQCTDSEIYAESFSLNPNSEMAVFVLPRQGIN